jgi:alkanesulfonate monooxygenase SsuD/methylene tetrahydromethanopterin reductase-like flavin-dependent oxidoreductase (luciferase family)
MGDYGHELEFGVFITPSGQQPDAVVELAVTADRAGLDLVTFQDHPYQPAFLDTWTLLSFVAARTQRIHLSGNVLNLPLRNPAVLARSVASLDRLSGGRAELGMGAGGFWDAIEAMGARRLTPTESVDALAEAIDVIRLLWDTDGRGVLKYDGKYYQLSGAKRGPAPAHQVGIWVGAYKPRMLRLTGRLADGWLPSLGYLRPGQLAEGNAVIDQAAADAGRDPAAIRRLLNIGGDAASPERLAELALADGIGTFILAADEAADIRRYAEEVAPAVREFVAAARAGGAARDGSGGTAASRLASPAFSDPAQPTVTPTPDDGVRLSQTRIWDEAARPTRPVADPPAEGYPASSRQAGAELVAVHDMLRGELTNIRDLVAQVREGRVSPASARSAINQMTMRQNDWTMGAYCESYCRVVTQHHSLEDAAVFPRLRARDPGLGPVLDRLEQEHEGIHHVLDDVDRALVRYVAAPGNDTEPNDAELNDTEPNDTEPNDVGLQAAIDLLTDALLSHLAYEERELIEPLSRYGFW